MCSDLPGFRAVAGGVGAFAAPGDPGSLATQIRSVLSDRSRAEEMRTSGGRIANAFSWERLVLNLERIYDEARKEPIESLEPPR